MLYADPWKFNPLYFLCPHMTWNMIRFLIMQIKQEITIIITIYCRKWLDLN